MNASPRRLLATSAIVLACAVGFASVGFAQGKGHHGGGGMTNSNGLNSTDRDLGTNRAGDRMNSNGLANTNGPNSMDRDTGKARSQDRSHR